MIRVFIAAASSVSGAGLRSMLVEAGFEVVGSAPHVESLDGALLEASPDVILLEDADASSEHGRRPAALGNFAHDAAVVLLADRLDQTEFTQVLRGGVRGVLPHDISAEQLQAALQAVVAGLVVTHPEGIGALLPTSGSTMTEVTPLAEPLTKREREVLQMLLGGLANKEIAARLAISDHTAKFHVASILSKLGASTRTEAVALGIRHGLVLL